MIRIPGFSRKRPELEEPPVAPPLAPTVDETRADEVRPNEPFMSRFSRRKVEARQQELKEAEEAALPVSDEPPVPELTDEDMPAIDSLSFDSDFTGFMSPKVSEALRRKALKKLFLSPEFNIVDGLDEYAEDYTTFEALGDIVTADMKHQIEMEAKRKAEEAEKALAEGESSEELPDDSEEELADAEQEAEALAESEEFDEIEEDWEDDSEDV